MDEIYKRLNDDTEVEDQTDERSEIQEFFAGQTIFLTGSTGFVGKVFVEKLLRSCTDLNKIYFLVRPKKQPSAQRMKKYLDDPIFDRLKEEVPNCDTKVALVEGDLFKENMGLSQEDRAMLIEETTLMYHNASNVKFDEKISVSIRANVIGTKYMLDLAKECKRLLHIDDQFYPPPVDMNVYDILAVDEKHSRGIEEKAMKDIRGKWSNNYSFTKSIAESLVEQCAKQVPFACSVYRPSVITSTYAEPIRGWTGNLNGPVGLIIGCGIGFVHSFPRGIYPIDFTPIDMCVNALINENKRDAKMFYSDLRTFDWDEYAYAYWAGIRTYMLKDLMETAKTASRLFHRLILIQRVIYYIGQAIIIYFVARWLFPSFFN